MGKVEGLGGSIVEQVHQIGEHGWRGIIIDSEGNKCVLHSNKDD
jgi:predicted enzyme related to lactoylglutathione lyase